MIKSLEISVSLSNHILNFYWLLILMRVQGFCAHTLAGKKLLSNFGGLIKNSWHILMNFVMQCHCSAWPHSKADCSSLFTFFSFTPYVCWFCILLPIFYTKCCWYEMHWKGKTSEHLSQEVMYQSNKVNLLCKKIIPEKCSHVASLLLLRVDFLIWACRWFIKSR